MCLLDMFTICTTTYVFFFFSRKIVCLFILNTVSNVLPTQVPDTIQSTDKRVT